MNEAQREQERRRLLALAADLRRSADLASPFGGRRQQDWRNSCHRRAALYEQDAARLGARVPAIP